MRGNGMSYEIFYSPEALEDLDRVWMEVWQASQDLDTTDKYIEDLRIKIRSKRKKPKTGTLLMFMGEFMGVYYVKFKEYLAFYRVHGNAMEIWRILYARSDYMNTLFGRSEYILEDTDDLDN